jgi:DNA-binding NarL/FixJ family response regulator
MSTSSGIPCYPSRSIQSVAARCPVDVLIVDDHCLVRLGLRTLVEAETPFRVVAEEVSAEGAMHSVRERAVDIALIEIGLPGMSGMDLVRHLKQHYPRTKSIIVSERDERHYARRSIEAGADGYVMKDNATQAIIKAMRCVLSGNKYVSESVRNRVSKRADGDTQAHRVPADLLSEKELEVFLLIGQGMTKSEIAKHLNRSVNTIETHRSHIKQKLSARSSADLARIAFASCIKPA